jgi:hypothetical protein
MREIGNARDVRRLLQQDSRRGRQPQQIVPDMGTELGDELGDRHGRDPIAGAAPDPDVLTGAWVTWRSEVAFAEKFIAAAADLDVRGTYTYGDHAGSISLCQVEVHMIEEYARHIGHAELLRERLDGRVASR